MKKEIAIEKIKNKIAQIETLISMERFCPEYEKWHREVRILLQKIFGENSYQLSDFLNINFVYSDIYTLGDAEPFERRYRTALKEASAILTSIYEEIEEYGLDNDKSHITNPFNAIEVILNRFHAISRQLRRRYNDRDTLDVKDEYDVQDLLHSLLKLFFKDIRPEEWTPSYAGSSSRMDFLLYNEEIVIEVKKTRSSLKDKEIVDQLVVDIARYKEHPKCNALICFVYDPEGYIRNPVAIANDLEKNDNDLNLKIYIRPENN